MTFDPQHLYLALAVLLVGFLLLRSRGNVTSAEARRLVSEGARLVDVRSPGEFAQGHIEGSVNVPVGELSARIAEIGPPERNVVVYCASGARSAAAARMLKARGFANVRNLGAMARW